ncbi:glycosyltransferase family 4 protein [Caldanaerobacter subterraneus]|uniref:Glycosyltransferase involved in cell wall biosynthesis n=1 Tax=Caldanaerobacter subterraneus TaxID=911092 RepID=A0A4V2S7K0_9THEO|nr:glycosyltransferase family 4 protein [Caldanaerobacter subterraneus]TCO60250.1 glycosyltransferase involved in cell wall biosynthesis [Caldanaerobacter subterraneus]
MPKILQVSAVDYTVKNLLLPLIDRLKKEGFIVEIACSEGKESKELEKRGYVFKYVKIDRKISPISNIKSIINLYKIMRDGKYDVVHVHTPVAGVLARIAAKLARIPVVIYTAHGFYFHENMSFLSYKLFATIEKIMGKYFTDYIFTQSQEDYKLALDLKIIDKDRIAWINNGVDLNKFNPENIKIDIKSYKENLGITVDSKVICFIGRLVEEKGILDLLEAFKYLIKEYNNLYLMIIGDASLDERDKETKQKIKSYLDDTKLRERIILTGFRDDIPELLKISDIFVLPSYREGMPRSIIEAMAMGKPVVATNIRGCREEVVHGETGFLVSVSSPKEIYEAIKRLVDNDELIAEMGAKGRKRAIELYDEEKVLEKQVNIIKNLLKIEN